MPVQAAAESLFYSRLDMLYQSVQGQMAVRDSHWCDFVIYTSKGANIERIKFDGKYWEENFPKFYDSCIATKAVSPLHSVDCSMRKFILN